ncbi:MAG: 1-acyl-sn-glycerol-3-phosphate acyltransferase [Flavobacteriales bacterium]|nr:1-acyl-sn-glycerol-3-phosphate acyltransferase [Flavobacteriales bacterium]
MGYDFEDIRSYNDDEYQQKIGDLIAVEPLMNAIQSYFPELTVDQIESKLRSFQTCTEFQADLSCGIVQRIIDTTMESFDWDGVVKLDRNKQYLLISNHRDIILDSALINYCLNGRNYDFSEIAIGSNLVGQPWVKKLVRLNKSFIVKRNVPKEEMLEASKTLSAYINYALHEKRNSIWIAQREGRAKDGNDKTNPALLKMFGLANEGDLLDYLIGMNITPVSISYELDPCDYLKVPELIQKSRGETYQKSPGEDDQHMLLGLQGNKGRVFIRFGQPVNDKVEYLRTIKNRNELLKAFAEEIDKEVYAHYKLWPTNYIAYDLFTAGTKYAGQYTEGEKAAFVNYMDQRLAQLPADEQNKHFFLSMYANPVINKEQSA